MKKTLSILLSLFLVFTLYGCSNESDDSTLENIEVFNEDDYSIIISSFTSEDEQFLFNLDIENKTDNVDYTVEIDYFIINNIMIDCGYIVTLESGNSSSYEIDSDLFMNEIYDSISSISQLEMKFIIYDNPNYLSIIDETSITLYPYGEEEAYDYEYIVGDADILIVDEDDFTWAITSIDEEEIYGDSLSIYLENNSDEDVYFHIVSGTINNIEADPLYVYRVNSGCVALGEFTYDIDILDKNNITSIEEITYDIEIYNLNDQVVYEDTFTLTLN